MLKGAIIDAVQKRVPEFQSFPSDARLTRAFRISTASYHCGFKTRPVDGSPSCNSHNADYEIDIDVELYLKKFGQTAPKVKHGSTVSDATNSN